MTMLARLWRYFVEVDRRELLKVLLLACVFFLVIAAYTVTRELKDAVFSIIVGQERKLFAYAKIFSMFVLVPAIFFHSRLVDIFRRHQLLYMYSLAYAVLGAIFVYYLGHPTIGLYNTASSPSRIFGWLFYFFIEGYAPLVVSVFWAFSNSITPPKSAKNNYPIMIAGSKLGGISAAVTAWFLLKSGWYSDVVNLQACLGGSSILLLFVPLVVYLLVTKVPHKDMHGYEAGYKLEKERHKAHYKAPWWESMLSGLILLFKYPYVMGIFGMTFFFELVSQALKVENIVFVKTITNTISDFTAALLWQAILVHIVALIVVLFGTRALITILGERRSLMVIPAVTGLSIIAFVLSPSYATAVFAFVVTRSVNYAIAAPLRESLFIPTLKDIQFKSKSWIDGVGQKFAKTCASSFNMYTDGLIGPALLAAQTTFFSAIVFFWFIVAYLLGWRYEKAVKRNEVIGEAEVAAEIAAQE